MKIGPYGPCCLQCTHHNVATEIGPGELPSMHEPPPADCACACHEPWRQMHHVPAIASDAAA